MREELVGFSLLRICPCLGRTSGQDHASLPYSALDVLIEQGLNQDRVGSAPVHFQKGHRCRSKSFLTGAATDSAWGDELGFV